MRDMEDIASVLLWQQAQHAAMKRRAARDKIERRIAGSFALLCLLSFIGGILYMMYRAMEQGVIR